MVHHGDVEVGHTRATAVVRPNHVGGLWPQLRRRSRDYPGLIVEGHAAWQTPVDGPREYVATRIGLVVDGEQVVSSEAVAIICACRDVGVQCTIDEETLFHRPIR